MSKISFASTEWGTGNESEVSTVGGNADGQDVAQFQSWLKADPTGRPAEAAPAPLGDVLQAVSHALHDREAGFFKALERTARTGDLIEGLAVQQRLSALYLDHGLAVKVIAKSTQAIESLMRMQ